MRAFISICFLFISLKVYAVDYDKAAAGIEADLKEANSKLDKARTRIFSEREKLAGDISKASVELEKHKKSSGKIKAEIENLLNEISELDRKVKTNSNSQIDLLKNAIQVRRELETIIPETKTFLFKSDLDSQDEALKKENFTDFFNSFSKVQNQLITDGSSIKVTDIEAVSKSGDIKTAKLISLSHSHDFLLIEGKGGLAVKNQHHPYPELKPVPGITSGLEALINNGSGLLIFDFSNGLALKKEAREKTLSERFNSGGMIMYPLSLLALLCLIVGLWKTFQLYIIRSRYDDKVSKVLNYIHGGETEEAEKYINTLKTPVRNLLNEALLYKDTTRENLEELLNEKILTQIPKLDRFMPVLSVSAGAAPLLGLLGTVMGIIKTFEMISLYGTGDPNTMAGGISEALVTTQAGLMVAIPALIWHAVLNRRLKTIVGNLEKAMLGFINGLSLGKTNV